MRELADYLLKYTDICLWDGLFWCVRQIEVNIIGGWSSQG